MQKVLKVLAFILLAIFLVFLALGVIKSKHNYECSVRVKGDISSVFKTFKNQELLSQWLDEVSKVETVHLSDSIVGTSYKVSYQSGEQGQASQMLKKVSGYDDGNFISYDTRSGVIDKKDDFHFIQDHDYTTITAKHEMRANRYFARCALALGGNWFKQADQAILDQFATYYENQK